MTAKPDRLLLLAGTQEARKLAGQLAADFPNLRVTASFAGVVRDLPDLGVPTRVGGFGGVAGLTEFLGAEKVSLVVDATHPFAAQMSRNAVAAAKSLALPLVRLERPAWQADNKDIWQHVPSVKAAADVLPASACAFLAIGRKEIQLFAHRRDIRACARMIEPPTLALPSGWELILERPPVSVEEEIQLFDARGITHVVTKNSGGNRSYAKIEAARRLGLPVIMVDRPLLPAAKTAADIPELTVIIRSLLSGDVG